MKPTKIIAALAVRAGRSLWKRVPDSLKKNLEDRFFYAVYHSTRVTNDAYGYKPPPPGGNPP